MKFQLTRLLESPNKNSSYRRWNSEPACLKSAKLFDVQTLTVGRAPSCRLPFQLTLVMEDSAQRNITKLRTGPCAIMHVGHLFHMQSQCSPSIPTFIPLPSHVQTRCISRAPIIIMLPRARTCSSPLTRANSSPFPLLSSSPWRYPLVPARSLPTISTVGDYGSRVPFAWNASK
jgi:hypothetical protein